MLADKPADKEEAMYNLTSSVLTNHNQQNHLDEDSDSDTSLMIDEALTDHKTSNSKLTNHRERRSSYPGQSAQQHHVINSNNRNATSVKDYNSRLRQLAVKEVKKPGKSK